MSKTWLLWNSGPGASAENMAADEALLESIATIGAPVLRFYSWRESAATFGYFQKYAEVERWTPLRPLLRRPTGGGLVPHDGDWTYSLAFPPGHAWHALRAVESYQRLHRWLAASFAALGLAAELAACCRKELPGQCFAGAEQFDVLLGGRKIAGAAQRRTRHGLLIQGSVQPPAAAPPRADWQRAFCAVVEREAGVNWKNFTPGSDFRSRVEILAREKYSTTAHNQRR
ncbi:MAG: lipoate--protein ligase family protein [Verrucomicrobia bacterium]|nr:lipoate--protein ligase family protein [Verrucomicrobiota bacterium]